MTLICPTGASGVPLRLGDFTTITEALDYAASGEAGFNFLSSRGELAHVLPYTELRTEALSLGRRLLSAGLRPGDRLVLIGETVPDFPACFFACLYAGIVPCIAPAETNVLAPAAYARRIQALLGPCSAMAILLPDKMNWLGPEGVRILTLNEVRELPESTAGLPPATPDTLAYVQFSSGSTTDPKGILITHAALMANLAAILRHGIRLTASDRAFSWLPFYHDMGLVGFLLAPLAGQCTVDYLAPSAFARRPALWLHLMSSLGSTICYAPTFGYRLASDRLKDADLSGIDLSRWRLAGIGGDMIQTEPLERFARQFEPAGFRRSAFAPSYGLAEATLAVTFAHDGIRTASPAMDAHRSWVVCGPALPGYDIRIIGAEGQPLADGSVGRVTVNGPSLMSGYAAETDQGLTLTSEGYLDTGDLGFLHQSALVVTGRAKDLVIVNGRNIWPADIEWTVQQAAGIRHGHTLAFAVPEEPGRKSIGADRIVILVEPRSQTARDDLRPLIADAVSREIGVAAEILFVPPQTITTTSSGKLRRAAARDAYLAGTLPVL